MCANTQAKERFARKTDPIIAEYRAGRDDEKLILVHVELLTEIGDCRLDVLPERPN